MVSKLVFCICPDAVELDVEIFGYLLDQSFDNCAHDFRFLHADLENFLVRDDRLRWVRDDPPFELGEPKKR